MQLQSVRCCPCNGNSFVEALLGLPILSVCGLLGLHYRPYDLSVVAGDASSDSEVVMRGLFKYGEGGPCACNGWMRYKAAGGCCNNYYRNSEDCKGCSKCFPLDQKDKCVHLGCHCCLPLSKTVIDESQVMFRGPDGAMHTIQPPLPKRGPYDSTCHYCCCENILCKQYCPTSGPFGCCCGPCCWCPPEDEQLFRVTTTSKDGGQARVVNSLEARTAIPYLHSSTGTSGQVPKHYHVPPVRPQHHRDSRCCKRRCCSINASV